MGCDYYVLVYLEIEHTKGISYCELPIIRGYYGEMDYGVYDSDDEEKDRYYNSREYEKLYRRMVKLCLTPRNHMIIYLNGLFIKEKFKNKYLPIIQDKITGKTEKIWLNYVDTGELTDIRQIIKITKKEIRNQR
uniref:Uncharacterized protein n=1 Tax=viral metagenome TaxID=1070528 RepID=A0A6C0EPA7_9ZZZZ